jgi:hypothetical protein
MCRSTMFAAMAAAVACSFTIPPAQALTQRDRVFVASYGADTNPCTFGSPCRTFQHAVDTVAAGGEVTAIDSAGFGQLTIAKAVTLTSPNGVEAGIATAADETAILIVAGSSDIVVLRGLTLDGAGAGVRGVNFLSGARLEMVGCAVRNYTDVGINIGPSAPTSVLISNSLISNNTAVAASGLQLQTSTGGSVTAALNGVTISGNYVGITNNATQGGTIEMSIANTHIDNNLEVGMNNFGASGSTSNVILKQVTFNQTPFAITVGGYSTVWLSHVTQAASAGFNVTSGITFENTNNNAYSDGTNHLMGGLSGSGAFLQTWHSQ